MKPTENMGEDFNQGANFAYVKTFANSNNRNKFNKLHFSKDMTKIPKTLYQHA